MGARNLSAAAEPVEASCSDASLQGAYGFRLTGTNTALNRLYAIVGRIQISKPGELKVTATQSVQGKVMRVAMEGKYSVRPDCTGSAKFPMGDTSSINLDFVIVNRGQNLEFISADDGTVESGSGTRIAAVTGADPAK